MLQIPLMLQCMKAWTTYSLYVARITDLSYYCSSMSSFCDSLQLEAEAKVPASAKFWCPEKNCSNLLIVHKSTYREVECTLCRALLCTACRSFGHSGMTCAEAKVSSLKLHSLNHDMFRHRQTFQRMCAACQYAHELHLYTNMSLLPNLIHEK